MLGRFFRLDSSYTDAEKHTLLERILWAIPPVLVAWLLCSALYMLVLNVLPGPLS
jgi:hypothetical protein